MNTHADDTHGSEMSAPSTVSAAEAGVSVQLMAPSAPQTGTPVTLIYRLTADGAPLTDVVVSHEQEMHLIIVRQDLERFQHVHPTRTGNPGEYRIDVTFPEPGTYVLYDEFTRSNGLDIVQRDELVVGAASGTANLSEDRAPKTVANDARVSLSGEGVRAGQEASFTFRIDNPKTGEPVRDLRPYLGAPAHVVILDEAAASFAHTHGEAVGAAASAGHGDAHSGGHAADGVNYGPEIAFHHTFTAPGLYKVWGQFKDHHGNVITADFVVRVDQ